MDPLVTTDEWGHVSRPYTYSKDCSFSGSDEGCTSIDGVLLNKVAFYAMLDVQVLEHFGRQHRPIKVDFNWETIHQTGFILHKFAPIDTTNILPRATGMMKRPRCGMIALLTDLSPQ